MIKEKWKPEYLKKWNRKDPSCDIPKDNYMGDEWFDYYVAAIKCRDSKCLERSNYECILKAVDPEENKETVVETSTNHWAFGYFDWILIHEDDIESLKIADKIYEDLENYSVVDEEHYSEMEYNEATEYWDNCSLSEKIDRCKEADLSIFAARRHPLDMDCGYIWERLTCDL